jgi:hypothetical protein
LSDFSLSSDTDCGSISSIDKDKSICGSSCSSSSKRHHHKKHGTKVKQFTVTLGPKGASENASKIDGDKCFYVNGVATPNLKLRKGTIAKFVVSTGADYPFTFTDNAVGYSHGKEARSILTDGKVSEGTFMIKVDHHLPKVFYYQCPTKSYIGAMCFVE